MEANWRYKGNIAETYTTAKSWNWFIKKDLQQHLEKKGKVDLIFKSLLSLSVEDERIVVWPHWGKFCYFFCFVWNHFPTLVTEDSKNCSLKVMGL